MALAKLRYLLFQVRKQDDPMRQQEVNCFSHWLRTKPGRIDVLDLIHESPTLTRLHPYDVVLMGGSGDYSVAAGGDWLPRALDAMNELYALNKPTFGSCWGFQAMARALGGKVVTDLSRAELGTLEITLSEAGRRDPVLGPIGPRFLAHEGHQDIVIDLPPDATALAFTQRGVHQAFTFSDKSIYCTQFHPELDRKTLIERVYQYPEYVERIAGVSIQKFTDSVRETPSANTLLYRFVQHVFGVPD